MIPSNPHCVIEVDGEMYDSWKDASLFAGLEVDLTTNEASVATWRVFDPDFQFLDKWTTNDGIAVLPARAWLGFGATLALGEPVFKGLLARVERGVATSTFRFYDTGFKMRQFKQTEYHRGLDDVGVIAKLAKQNGLEFEGPSPALKLDKHKSLMQDEQTDWEHALERAEEAGLVLYVRGDTLFAKEPAKTGQPVLTLSYRRDFVMRDEFSLSYKVPENREGRPAKVETRGRGRGGRRLRGSSTERQRGTRQVEVKRDLSISSKRHADRRAQARYELQREHAFSHTVSILPAFKERRPDVRDTVELLHLGELFSGRYLCDRVVHRFGPAQLTTDLDLYRDIKE